MELYRPSFYIQELVFPIFPSEVYYFSLLLFAFLAIVISVIKPSVVLNVFVFILLAILNLPITAYNGAGHNNHLFVMVFFMSLFLLPNSLTSKDYKRVEYFYAGILLTYTFAGLWKFVSIGKDLLTDNPRLSWLDIDAAKLNTMMNYYFADTLVPRIIIQVYDFKLFWVVTTILAILLQTLSILGAFNRRLLSFTMIYLIIFHVYNLYFVYVDFSHAIWVLLVTFFPYHIFVKCKNIVVS